jgi:hypothetical protein
MKKQTLMTELFLVQELEERLELVNTQVGASVTCDPKGNCTGTVSLTLSDLY